MTETFIIQQHPWQPLTSSATATCSVSQFHLIWQSRDGQEELRAGAFMWFHLLFCCGRQQDSVLIEWNTCFACVSMCLHFPVLSSYYSFPCWPFTNWTATAATAIGAFSLFCFHGHGQDLHGGTEKRHIYQRYGAGVLQDCWGRKAGLLRVASG